MRCGHMTDQKWCTDENLSHDPSPHSFFFFLNLFVDAGAQDNTESHILRQVEPPSALKKPKSLQKQDSFPFIPSP